MELQSNESWLSLSQIFYCLLLYLYLEWVDRGLMKTQKDQLIFASHWPCIPVDVMVYLELLEPKCELIKAKTWHPLKEFYFQLILMCDFLALRTGWAGCFSSTVSLCTPSPCWEHAGSSKNEYESRLLSSKTFWCAAEQRSSVLPLTCNT